MELKFRKKPLVIEAFQMTEERRTNNADWPNWLHEAWMLDREAPGSLYPTEEGTGDGRLSIGTLEGQHLVSWGDWIIQGVHGELYPCKPDIFAKTYEPAEASPASAPEGWKWRRHARTRWEAVGHWDSIEEMAYNDMLGRGWDVEKLYSHAAPTPPVSEDRKDMPPVQSIPKERLALNVRHQDCHKAADAFWRYWNEYGETHKHGYYESTWGAINQALRTVGVVEHEYRKADAAMEDKP